MGLFKSIGKVAGGALKVLAPALASALPGPLGSVAREFVTEALQLEKDATDAEIEKALATTNPEVFERIRKADQDFILQMEKNEVDLTKLANEDRASARARQVALKDKTPPVMGWTVLLGWLGLTAFLLWGVPPFENRELLNHSLGILDLAVGMVLGYFFGSSVGSKQKTVALMGKD